VIGEPLKHRPMRSRWEGVAVLIAVVLPLVVGLLAMASTGSAAEPVSDPLPQATTPADAKPQLLVNLNTADAVQLSLVPGLTPKRVQSILEWRNAHSFQAPIDLLKVKGIGMTTYKKAKPWVTVDGPAVRTLSRPAVAEELLANAG
jgi:predicted DNA-binding helix-hairpin-helix protein